MNVVELYNLTKWVRREVVKTELEQKYVTLQAILQQNSNQSSQPFEEPKNNLIEAVQNVDLISLTKPQIDFLNKIEILHALGDQGVKQIEDILYHDRLDIKTASNKFQGIIFKLEEGVNIINKIFEGLNGNIQDDIDEYGDDVLMRISFLDDASMSNVEDFKDWGKKWHSIGYGIAIAHGATPQDIKIVGASRGSVVLELITTAPILATIGVITWWSLKVAEKVQGMVKTAAEIKKLNLENKRYEAVSANLAEGLEEEKQACIKAAIDSQIKKLKLKKTSDGDKINALTESITTLIDFIEKGGELDFVIPEEENSDSEEDGKIEDKFAEIRNNAKEIRTLKNELKLIEHNKEEVEEDANEENSEQQG